MAGPILAPLDGIITLPLFSCLWWLRHSCLPCLPRASRGASNGLCFFVPHPATMLPRRSSPRCHPACPEPSRRDRSGPIFSLAPNHGASGRGMEGSWLDRSSPRSMGSSRHHFFLPLVAQAFLPARAWGEVPPVLADVRCGEARLPAQCGLVC